MLHITQTHSDHPRSRGVYCYRAAYFVLNPGSSPLARGLPAGAGGVRPRRRIIPARAGFTAGGCVVGVQWPDHPRSRGVYRWTRGGGYRSWGSSPLARGLHGATYLEVLETRIIPARAGFTATSGLPAARPRDHPRSRGVYGGGCARWDGRAGSSPLARGLRDARTAVNRPARIIPARAGFTGAVMHP